MRVGPYNEKVRLLRYGIREIVDLGQKLKTLIPGFKFIGENIGDPVAKGWQVPAFLRQILVDAINDKDNATFAYTHSRGRLETRKWVVEYARRFCPSSRLDYEYVVFTSGLGAAISALYHMLAPGARILQPLPAYPAHISMERFAAGSEAIGYRLDPLHGWQPDVDHMEQQIKRHKNIAGILVINPNNPTGSVCSAGILKQIVRLAERHQLMLISDEVYFRMIFNGGRHAHAIELAEGRVPLIVMRGLSKDVPWPGGRCGWLEFHNVDADADFKKYAESVKKRVMMEVCSTTLPQFVVPLIYDHPEYPEWLSRNNAELEKTSAMMADILERTAGLSVNRIQGAFYMMPLFKPGVLNDRQTLPIANAAAREFIRSAVSAPDFPLDKRFAYYLLASTGVCVVPATDFESPHPGFRVTTLDRDPVRRDKTYRTIADSIGQYLGSG